MVSEFELSDGSIGEYHSLPAMEEKWGITLSSLPYSIRVLLEAALRKCDGFLVTDEDVQRIANWSPEMSPSEIPFMPSQTIGLKAGAVQAGNIAMLAALCASGELPFGPEALEATIKANLPEKIQAVNLKALELGVAALNA